MCSSEDDLPSGGIPSHPTSKLAHHNKRGKSGNPSTRLSLPPIDDPEYRPRLLCQLPLIVILISCPLYSTAPGDHDNAEMFLASTREQTFMRGAPVRNTYSHPSRGHHTLAAGGAHIETHHAHRQGGFFRKITSKFSRK